MALQPKRFTADGALFASGIDALIHAITVVGGTDAATCDIKEGGTGGTVVYSVKAPTADSRSVTFPKPIEVSDAFVDVTGTSPVVSIAAEPIN